MMHPNTMLADEQGYTLKRRDESSIMNSGARTDSKNIEQAILALLHEYIYGPKEDERRTVAVEIEVRGSTRHAQSIARHIAKKLGWEVTTAQINAGTIEVAVMGKHESPNGARGKLARRVNSNMEKPPKGG